MMMMIMEELEMEQEPDWDLQAVVRGFTASATVAAHRPPGLFGSDSCSVSKFVKDEESEELFGRIEHPFGGIGEGLEDLCKPFCSDLMQQPFKPTTTTRTRAAAAACSPESGVLGVFMEQQKIPAPPAQEQQQLQQGQQQLFLQQQHQPEQINQSQVMFGAAAAASSLVSAGSTAQSQRIVTATPPPQTQRAKKRKNVIKKVCHVPAEGLSSDMWAWRKYGQKPIKGSPYPRGYYRCSSSKGCLARKQVERNRSDPKMFIFTYTGEHNHPMPTHRNSLAGSTRQKTISSQSQSGAAAGGESGSPPTSTSTTTMTPPAHNNSSSPTTSNSPATEYEDLIKDDEDNEMGISDMILNDDIFAGFEDLDVLDPTGDCFPDQFTTSIEFPWLTGGGSSTATAAGSS